MLTPFSLPRTWLAHHDESVANPPPARARPTLNPLRISGLQPLSAVNVRFGRLHCESRQSAFGQFRTFAPHFPARVKAQQSGTRDAHGQKESTIVAPSPREELARQSVWKVGPSGGLLETHYAAFIAQGADLEV